MKAKDIKPGVVYGFQRGRGEYASVQAVMLLAPADSEHLYQTTSNHRSQGAPAFAKARRDSKPHRGKSWSAPNVGYPAVFGPADALDGVTLEHFEATASAYHDSKRGIEFEVLTSLTGVIGPYEEVVAAQQQRREAANQERDREQRRRAAALQRAAALGAALAKAGVKASADSPNEPTGLYIKLDEVDKLVGLLPVSEED